MDRTNILFKHRIWWHVAFWIAIDAFYTLTYGAYNDRYYDEFIANFYLLPIRMIGTYIMIYWLIPLFLIKRKYVEFAILAFVHAVLYGMAIAYIISEFIICPTCIYAKVFPFGMRLILESIASNYEIPTIAATIKLFKHWYNERQRSQSLETEKLEAELKFLKSQLNPHFLFNTLNNLYALTLKKSDNAPDVVIKLSEILDYMLYRSNAKEANLDDEIKLIRNYIELEKIRYGKRLNLEVQINGDANNKKIAPLLLLPFIENSFKHGACQNIRNPYIKIELIIEEHCLKLTVINSFDNTKTEDKSLVDGIGLKNAQRRLELLYPSGHELKIEQEQNFFKVYLCLSWKQDYLCPESKAI